MTLLEAITKVLREAEKPLHAKEITEKILSSGLWSTSGKTPEATVAARQYTDIKKKGDASAFMLAAPQTFTLRDVEKPAEPSNDTYSFTDCAEKVLEQFGEGKPMHYRKITEKALELGWLTTEGKTPEATMYAQILTEIKRYQRRGEQPRFVQHEKGFDGYSGEEMEAQCSGSCCSTGTW